MTVIAGAVLLVAAVMFFLLHPMLTGRRASLQWEEDEPTEAESRRRVTLLALRDVEYDYATGKLGEDDYHALKRELAAEALAALTAAEAESASLGAVAPQLEAEIARLRGGLDVGTTCAVCGSGNDAGSRFCAYCGVPLRAAGAGPQGAPRPERSPERRPEPA
jgi:cytochrome c-type biogenesis protein CcmI